MLDKDLGHQRFKKNVSALDLDANWVDLNSTQCSLVPSCRNPSSDWQPLAFFSVNITEGLSGMEEGKILGTPHKIQVVWKVSVAFLSSYIFIASKKILFNVIMNLLFLVAMCLSAYLR